MPEPVKIEADQSALVIAFANGGGNTWKWVEDLVDEAPLEEKQNEVALQPYRLITTSRATFPLGPNGLSGFPLSSAFTPPALPNVSTN